jgi:sec-independent protein translocase protein TatC
MRPFLNSLWWILAAPFRFVYWLLRSIGRGVLNFAHQLGSFFGEEPEDEPLGTTIGKVAQDPRGLLPHVDALRKHIFRALLVFMLATALSFTFANQILAFLARPLPNGVDSIQAIEVTEPIGVLMRISLLSGFALALPYIVLELFLFIGPGLHRRTRVAMLFLGIPAATVLFLTGMGFAYFVMLPTALPFLLGILDFETNIRASSYVRFVTGVMFWIGILFQLPLVVYIIARLGLVRGETLLKQWRLAIIFIAVIAAMITPTVDPVNMAIVMGPLTLLYFLSIGLAFLAQRGRPPAQAEDVRVSE